jgi:hypothetical protein
MVPFGLLPASLQDDPRLQVVEPGLLELEQVIGPRDVVLAPPDLNNQIAAAAGKVVCPNPMPFLVDWSQRRQACLRFLADPVGNTDVIRQYDVRWVVTPRSDRAVAERLAEARLGPARLVGGFVVTRVDR